jgi:hypothetical protein
VAAVDGTQRALLQGEGVAFRPSGRVEASAFWQPTVVELRALEARWA